MELARLERQRRLTSARPNREASKVTKSLLDSEEIHVGLAMDKSDDLHGENEEKTAKVAFEKEFTELERNAMKSTINNDQYHLEQKSFPIADTLLRGQVMTPTVPRAKFPTAVFEGTDIIEVRSNPTAIQSEENEKFSSTSCSYYFVFRYLLLVPLSTAFRHRLPSRALDIHTADATRYSPNPATRSRQTPPRQRSVFTYVSVLVIAVQWFTQLFSLLFLSTVYFFAVFSSKGFRTISLRNVKIANCSIISLGLLLSVPFLTKYCGYKYYLQGHYWYFDFEKPYTYIYAKVNVALQGICVATVIAADTAIMWKVIQIRSHVTIRNPLSIVSGGQSMRLTYGREARLALNFVMLSACFLIMTVSYNVILGDGMWRDIITKFTLLLNLAKLAIYALETPAIRYEIINLFGCCKRIEVCA
ncbi:unnamed protein product [Cylicocyclus nassatus]|uniref:Uncharacterized protein n=1 Tax=Cylicocyclus nassatus TaxID=53992 RepID=A0AA36GJ89_CYLNA|nr:unnamed protein product [Cylicocyclus nassatus]